MSNKLLLADDSITIQKVVGIIFANEDYELTVVDNGDAALEKAKQIVPDIILVDALMPGKNGYEVCAGIRQDAKLASIPLLLMTGAFEPFDEDKARQSGADDFISKPFESQQLIDKVRKLIELGKQRGGSSAAMPIAETANSFQPPFTSGIAPIEPVAPEFTPAFAAEPVVSESPEEVFALDEAAVEGSIDDDLWGAFDLEDVGGAGDFGVVADVAPVAAPVAPQMDDAFSFADVNDDFVEVSTVGAQSTEDKLESGWEAVEEQAFALEEEDQAELGQPAEIAFAEEPTELESVHEVSEPIFAAVSPFEENLVVEEVAAPVAAEEPAAEFVAPVKTPDMDKTGASETNGGTTPLSHAQLVAALSSLSRDVIEKIVWEVVPDLAEVLIKEEIRKLKGSTGN